MSEDAVFSPIQIRQYLERGCAYNTPLSIFFESSDGTYRYRSRLLDIKQVSRTNSLIIDRPASDGPSKALTSDANISLFFVVGEERFLFESKVLGKATFDLGEGKIVPALEVTYPSVLRNGQRRAYYRVSVPLGKPVSVKCSMIADGADHGEQMPESEESCPDTLFEAHVLDVSAGGILILLDDVARNLLSASLKLNLQLSLSRDESPLRLMGRVVRIEEKTSSKNARAGIEFIDMDEIFEHKIAKNRLLKYVAERQREIIKLESE